MEKANPTMTRRAVLAGTTASTIATACANASPQEARLANIIQQHERAWQNLEGAGNQLDACDEAFSPRRALVPLAVHEDGTVSGGYMELDKFDEAKIRDQIETVHDGLFRAHCSKWAEVALPEFVDAAYQTIKASLKRTHENFDAILADAEKQERESGMIEAREQYKAASRAEIEARVDLILYRPKTTAEVEEKRAYVESSLPFIENWAEDQPAFMPTLLAKTAEVRA